MAERTFMQEDWHVQKPEGKRQYRLFGELKISLLFKVSKHVS